MTAATTTDFRVLNAMLESYKRATLGTLLAYLPDREPRRHLYDVLPDYPLRGGKGFRPAICIATCRAFGGETEQVLRSAAAIELFHNAFLVHDDVEDGSDYRRGLPTLHVLHGVPVAVNVGDAMNALGIKPLMDNRVSIGSRLTWKVFVEVEQMVRQSAEGQAMEIGWVRDNICDVTYDDYLRMTLKKTCWYTCITPLRVGALIGSRDMADLSALNLFGFYMGAAFQIQDDLLNLVGEHERYGKEIGGDIWEGKRTLVLIHLYQHLNASERQRLELFLSTPRPERNESDVAWVLEEMASRGSIDYARSQSRRLAGGALYEFEEKIAPLPQSPDKQFLRDLVLYMVERDL